jgi:uncharacterized membrane protein YfcA
VTHQIHLGIVLTVYRFCGRSLLLDIPTRALQLTIAVKMILVAVFLLLRRDGDATQHSVSTTSRVTGYALTLVLAVYGGVADCLAPAGIPLCSCRTRSEHAGRFLAVSSAA